MRAVISFQGFTEGDSHRTGTEDLYFKVVRKVAGDDILTILPQPWTFNVKHLAHQLARQGIKEVALISFSHGMAAVRKFCEWAYKLGIKVSLWLSCDSIYRPEKLPRFNCLQFLSFRSLSDDPVIEVPANIGRVAGVRQKIDPRLRGHKLVRASARTDLATIPFLNYTHTLIDQSPEWFALVRGELEEWSGVEIPMK